ncbi:Macrophage-expressed gene 1 protein, partial [Pseudolycoriella hygida]
MKIGLHCSSSLPKLPIIAGRGWDNLVNKEMGQLIDLTYKSCKTTDDGKLLIPDHIYVIPIRETTLNLRSELIDNWINCSDITATTINVDSGFNALFAVSGQFSYSNQRTKQHQVEDKTITSRVSFKSTMYVVGYEPSANLDSTLKELLLKASAELELENLIPFNITTGIPSRFNKTDYLLELIVRDYGTHSLSRIDLGAVIYKEDYIDRSFDMSTLSTRQKIQVSASASFASVFNLGASYSTITSTDDRQSYENVVRASYVQSIGGGQIRTNMSVDSWIETVPYNLVPVDRSGDPLHFLITSQKLPELKLPALRRLQNRLSAAIDRYYAMNTRYGCIQMDSPKFDYHANVDDGSCTPSTNEYVFSGVFEICTTIRADSDNICDGLVFKPNPITGSLSCPIGYQAIPLLSKELRLESVTYRRIESCGGFWFWRHCDTQYIPVTHTNIARIDSYWCSAINGQAPGNNSGYMFGGLYSERAASYVNIVTSSQSCPPTYMAMYLHSVDLYVCVSDDYELGYKYSIPFGGFFSCHYGNPLYTDLKVSLMKARAQVSSNIGDYSPPVDMYTHSCPNTFTQHAAIVADGCEVNYCVPAGSFRAQGHMPVKRPPFQDFNEFYDESSDENSNDSGTDKTTIYSHGLVVGIVVAVIAVIAIPSVFALIWRCKKRRRVEYTEIGGENVAS